MNIDIQPSYEAGHILKIDALEGYDSWQSIVNQINAENGAKHEARVWRQYQAALSFSIGITNEKGGWEAQPGVLHVEVDPVLIDEIPIKSDSITVTNSDIPLTDTSKDNSLIFLVRDFGFDTADESYLKPGSSITITYGVLGNVEKVQIVEPRGEQVDPKKIGQVPLNITLEYPSDTNILDFTFSAYGFPLNIPKDVTVDLSPQVIKLNPNYIGDVKNTTYSDAYLPAGIIQKDIPKPLIRQLQV